ncbi:MAG: MFS transporter [Acidimicrobiales bacterium]|jgi:EmrB/QacA subfamily drug resistance transporter
MLDPKADALDTSPPTPRHAPDWVVLVIACLAQFMVVLDVSIVNVALPSMQRSLHFTLANAQWVVNAYVLTFAGFLLLGGRAADIFGRRRVYLAGLAIFTLASIGAGFAATGAQMIAIRALQGVGGAILSPATLTIIVTTFQGPRLPKAIGAWSAVAGAGGAAGALLGGLLTGYASWRWVFFINIPVGIFAATLAMLFLREMRNREAAVKLDVTGAVLVTGSLASLIYGTVSTTKDGWGASSTLSWFLAGAAMMVAFLFWEMKVASHPLVPFRIFRSRSLSTANIVMLLVGGAFFAMWYFLTFYFQYILRYDAVRTGFAFLPMALAIIAGAQLSSRILTRTGVRPLLLTGTSLATLGFLWISLIKTDSTYWGAIFTPSVLCAFAIGLLFAPLATAATAQVERSESGLASGVLNASRQVGGSVALAVLGTAAASRTATFLAPTSPIALVGGYQRAFQISAAITLVALGVSFALPRHTGRRQATAPSPSES